MLNQWEIDHARVHIILQDNAYNMAKALDDANLKSLPCLAHTATRKRGTASAAQHLRCGNGKENCWAF